MNPGKSLTLPEPLVSSLFLEFCEDQRLCSEVKTPRLQLAVQGGSASLQERADITDARLLPLEGPAFEAGPWLAPGPSALKRTQSAVNCAEAVQIMYGVCQTPAFLLGVCNFSVCKADGHQSKSWVLSL